MTSCSRREDTPASILRLVVTPKCNLRCIYCHNEGFPRGESEFPALATSRLEKVFYRLKDNKVKSICLTGGDPLISPAFETVLNQVVNVFGGEGTHVSTNGILLGRYLELMKRSRVFRINVSCDAIDKQRYLQIAGKDALDSVVKNIEKAVDLGFFVNVNCVLLSGINTDEAYIFKMLDFWKERGVRLSFLRLCFATNCSSVGRYDINDLVHLFNQKGLTSTLIHHSNRPPTLCYTYHNMEVAIRYFVPDRSISPCDTCKKREGCSEGLYHPRLGLSGELRSCILREDLKLDLYDEGALGEDSLGRFLKMFDAVQGTWIPADAESP